MINVESEQEEGKLMKTHPVAKITEFAYLRISNIGFYTRILDSLYI